MLLSNFCIAICHKVGCSRLPWMWAMRDVYRDCSASLGFNVGAPQIPKHFITVLPVRGGVKNKKDEWKIKHKSGVFPVLQKRAQILLILLSPLSHRHEETHSSEGCCLCIGWPDTNVPRISNTPSRHSFDNLSIEISTARWRCPVSENLSHFSFDGVQQCVSCIFWKLWPFPFT